MPRKPGHTNPPPRSRVTSVFTSHFVLANETTVFILVNALDFFVTYVLLAWPGSAGVETNPIARMMFQWGFRYLIAFKFGMATLAVVCCEIVARRNHRLGQAVLIILTAVVAVVVVYGLRLAGRHLLSG